MSFRLLIAVLISLLLFAGCGSDTPFVAKFINNSSRILTVSPDEGQKWEPFDIVPGDMKTVTISEDTVKFKINSQNVTWSFDEATATITFTDLVSDAEQIPDADSDSVCVEGGQQCSGIDSILYCQNGKWVTYSCLDVCKNNEQSATTGCAYSLGKGKDVCGCTM